jgi:hypothetical protein
MNVATAEPGSLKWRYEVPPTGTGNCLLLTTGRRCVEGEWYGEYGFAFIAWCQKPKRDKEKERALGLLE